MKDFLDDMVNASPVLQRKVAEETLIQDAVETIWVVMEEHGVTKAELAKRLNTSPSNVTQMLRGSRNMTLRSLASIAHELGQQVQIKIYDCKDVSDWKSIDSMVLTIKNQTWPKYSYDQAGNDDVSYHITPKTVFCHAY